VTAGWPALLGWPALAVALALSVAGIVRRVPWLPLIAAALLAPLSLYLLGAPRIGGFALVPVAGLLLCAVAITRRRRHLAWACLLPLAVGAGFLAALTTAP